MLLRIGVRGHVGNDGQLTGRRLAVVNAAALTSDANP